MKYILMLLMFVSCSQMKLMVDGESSESKIISHRKYKEIKGAGDVLKGVNAATLMITFRQTGKQEGPQDMLSFSVGGTAEKSWVSRASLRIDKDGYLTGIARAGDTEEAQNVRAKDKVSTGDFHVAALVVDYEKNEMHLFLDGKPVEATGSVLFKQTYTSPTPSISVSIGAEDDGSNFFFEGELKNPRVWRKRLLPEEILGLSQL